MRTTTKWFTSVLFGALLFAACTSNSASESSEEPTTPTPPANVRGAPGDPAVLTGVESLQVVEERGFITGQFLQMSESVVGIDWFIEPRCISDPLAQEPGAVTALYFEDEIAISTG